jgi:hypothetical protein
MIGRLLINQQAIESSNDSNEPDDEEVTKSAKVIALKMNRAAAAAAAASNGHSKLNRHSKHNEQIQQQQQQARLANAAATASGCSSKNQAQLCGKDMSRSLSLNDLIDETNYPSASAANGNNQTDKTPARKEHETDQRAKGGVYTMLNVPKNSSARSQHQHSGTVANNSTPTAPVAQSSYQNFSKLDSTNAPSSSGFNTQLKTPFFKQHQIVTLTSKQHQQQTTQVPFNQIHHSSLSPPLSVPPPPPPPPPPPIPSNLFNGSATSNNNNNNTGHDPTATPSTTARHKSSSNLASSSNQNLQPVSILKNSSNTKSSNDMCSTSTIKLSHGATESLLDQYRLKRAPRQRLEIDILPSHLSCARNKLIIASSYGKIRGK